ncbi:MAG: hypothetical protein VX463_05590, partial [Pseudomonadota bacterium]|nr:hypothetical protein [Pseudomonadota bacterium]
GYRVSVLCGDQTRTAEVMQLVHRQLPGAEALSDAAGQLTLDRRDPRRAEDVAVAAAMSAMNAGDALVLGPLFGAYAAPVGQAVAAGGLNVISFSNTPSAGGANVWISGLLADSEAERILDYAQSQGIRHIGLYHPDNALGRVARRAVTDAAGRRGITVDPIMAYPRSFEGIQNSAGAYAEAHRASGAQAALLPDEGQGLAAAASFLRYNSIGVGETYFLGLGGWADPALSRETSLDGGRFAAPDPERMAAFAARFQGAYGRAPGKYAWLGYDAVSAAAAMVRAARTRGDEHPFGLDDITAPDGFEGVAGPLVFTSDGLNSRGLAVLRASGSGPRVLETAPGGALPAAAAALAALSGS